MTKEQKLLFHISMTERRVDLMKKLHEKLDDEVAEKRIKKQIERIDIELQISSSENLLTTWRLDLIQQQEMLTAKLGAMAKQYDKVMTLCDEALKKSLPEATSVEIKALVKELKADKFENDSEKVAKFERLMKIANAI